MKCNPLFLALLFLSTSVFSQRFKTVEQVDTNDFSRINFQSLHIKDAYNLEKFKIFDSIVSQSNVFFIGENHKYRAANTQMQIAFIEYLHNKTNLRYLLMEFGFARGWLVNQYRWVLKIHFFDFFLTQI